MQWVKQKRGFTIVELLIVVVVIAILATITIVSFNGIQNRAKASAAQQAVQQAAKKVATYALENGEQYPTASGVDGADGLTPLGIARSGDTRYQYSANNATTPRSYCITATNGTFSFFVSNTQQSPRPGGCPGHGQGGVAAVTNLFVNPGATASINGFGSWNGSGGNTVSSSGIVSAPWSASGSAYRVQWGVVNSPASGDIQVTLSSHGLEAGKQYTVVHKLRGPNRASSLSVPAVYAASGTYSTAARSHTATLALSANQVITRWVTFTADAAAYAPGLRVVQGLTDKISGDALEVSEVLLYEGGYDASRSWAWGNSTDWEWLGAPHDSASRGPAL